MEFLREKSLSFNENGKGIIIEIEKKELISVIKHLCEQKAFLRMLFAADERHIKGKFVLRFVFSLPLEKRLITILLSLNDKENYPSVTPIMPAAHWYEREIYDMFGIKAEGHPDSRRLIFHESFPADSFPLRKDWVMKEEDLKEWGEGRKVKVPYEFFKVDGEGVYEIPVGPVHAGIIEPGHFRFSAVGETIFFLEARLFFTHKGVEKHFEHIGFERGVMLAERISGTSSFAHGACYCNAVEDMWDIELPERAKAIRTILIELERLYNHIGDIGNICAGTGLQVGNARGAYIKEKLMRLNKRIVGHRYLRGVNKIGGVTIDIFEKKDDLLRTLLEIEKEGKDFVDLLLNTISHLERLENTGKLAKEIAFKLGATGVAARASGIEDDIRFVHPHLLYDKTSFSLITDNRGDVLARVIVRAREAWESIKIIRQLLERDYTKEIATKEIKIVSHSEGLGYVESPRGSVFYFVKSGENGKVERVKVRSSSYCNWPLMPYAVHGNIVPDFPLCNKSFNLSYSGCDM